MTKRSRSLMAASQIALCALIVTVAPVIAVRSEVVDSAESETTIERIEPLVASGESRPNVILVVMDTTRADHLGLYGYRENTTPFLVYLAKEAAVFDRAFSTSSWTAPSTASVFTGQYPWNHGIVDGLVWHERRIAEAKLAGRSTMSINHFRPETRTLPERFKALGYATVGLVSNINIGNEIGFDRGFDRFIRRTSDTAIDIRNQLRVWSKELEATKPYFLYLHLNDAHGPYVRRDLFYPGEPKVVGDPRKDLVEKYRANYLSEIAYVDAQLERIFRMGFRNENTVFMVISDHGEEFGDHGGAGHSGGLHAELNRIAMLIHGPGVGIRAGRLADVNVSLIDVLPTLLELVGATVPDDVEGRSLAPLLRGSAKAEAQRDTLSRRVLFAHRRDFGEWFAAIEGVWKLIQGRDEPDKLYDLQADPEERNNRFFHEQHTAGRLLSLLEPLSEASRWRKGLEIEVEASDSLREQLKSLGYVQ